MTPNTEPKPATDAEIAEFQKLFQEMGQYVSLGYKPAMSVLARIEQEREMRRELVAGLKSAIGLCDCSDYNGKALIPCTDTNPCAGCYVTQTAEVTLARAAKMEADNAK